MSPGQWGAIIEEAVKYTGGARSCALKHENKNGREGGVLHDSRMRFQKSEGYKWFERRKYVGERVRMKSADGVKTKLSLLLPTLPVAHRGYERVVENGVVSSINEAKG